MSHKIDPREVLIYLNELGYTNITAPQLKEFIIDLKKLLKHEALYGCPPESINEEQSYCVCSEEESDYCSCESSEDQAKTKLNVDTENQIESNTLRKTAQNTEFLHTNPDKPLGKHISVHIYDTKSHKRGPHEHCVHINKEKHVNTDTELKLKLSDDIDNGRQCGTTESTIRSIRPCSTRDACSYASSRPKKPKLTLLRPTTTRSCFSKCDPVSLYHYYQSEWKRTKIPGQDKREDLRWAIRERMLNGPKVELRSRCNVQRCAWR